MKLYMHIVIITSLILFTAFFYQAGFGSVSFLLTTIYLSTIFVFEIRKK